MSDIAFLGCGSWGGALGFVAAQKGSTVNMWHRSSAVVEYIKKTRVHYLVPELHFPDNVLFTTDAEETLESADIIVIAIPSQSIRNVVKDLSLIHI